MNQSLSLQRYRLRKLKSDIILFFCYLAMLFCLFSLGCILWDSLSLGVQGIHLAIFTQMTPPPLASSGGLANAIMGSMLMVGCAMGVAIPMGILVGIYLCEYQREGLVAKSVRFMNDIMLSAPSIIIGLFVYALCVEPFHGFSGWAGSMALALLAVPIIIRTTDNMLALVPDNLREAAYALGAPRWRVVLFISLRAARAGVMTGGLLALARITGETAPLLFTALSNQFWNIHLSEPMASLPVIIFKFAMSPYPVWQTLAWAGVLVIILFILMLNIVAKIIAGTKE